MVRSPKTIEQNRLEKVWEQYIDTGTLDLGQVNNTIAASWERCRSASVNPIGGKCSRVYNNDYLQEFRESNRKLLDIATPMVESIYHSIQGSGFMVVLINKEGIILKTMGDHEALANAEKLNFYSGANWTEESVGTNAIGTCLAAGIPIQVTGAEHFCSNHHAWTCSAAPIRSPGGRVLGCLDISGPYEKMHTHTLAIVVAAASAIENQLRKELTSKELSSALSYYKAVVNSIPDGLLSVSAEGIITDVNTTACRILGLPLQKIKGQRADQVLRSVVSLKDILTLGQGRYSEEFFVDTPQGGLRCKAHARVFAGAGKKAGGAVVFIREVSTGNGPEAVGRQREAVNRSWGGHGPYTGNGKQEDPVRVSGGRSRASFSFKDIIGLSRQIRQAVNLSIRAAAGCSTVLLLGESGTGKEIFAQAIHNAGHRRDGPFIPVNCASFPGGLVQSELFGYSDGAYTGARRGGQPGKLEMADGGTLFLDEIGDMPLDMQANLLRVIQEKTVMRIGGNQFIPVDVRIIAATNKDLHQEVKNRNFREDLFYRLNVLTIQIPPLRDREGDVELLIEHFNTSLSAGLGIKVKEIDPAAMEILNRYHWPGNIRELMNVLEQAITFAEEKVIRECHLPQYLFTACRQSAGKARQVAPLEQMEIDVIRETLSHFKGNISRTAKALGIGRNTLYVKLNKYKIQI